MPELPEVQTVVTQLGRSIVGRRIAGFESDWERRVWPSCSEFRLGVRGKSVQGTRRLGKHVIVDLSEDTSIVIHLKMTGHLLLKTPETRLDPVFIEDRMNGYIHHVVAFDDGVTVEFSDMRKFGWLRLVPTTEVERLPGIASLGPDAFSFGRDGEKLSARLARRGERMIGEVLLDQTLIAGVGNIYRSETLFRAGILPTRRVASLDKKEWHHLAAALAVVLREATALRGMSGGDFRDILGKDGLYDRTQGVYQRDGFPCQKCATIIQRIKMGQRSAFLCPRCQR